MGIPTVKTEQASAPSIGAAPHSTVSPAPLPPEPTEHSGSRSYPTYIALLLLTGLWAAQLIATWGAWGNLTIDSGHEMYIPALLVKGKVLYRDVWFPYGPAGPYFNSLLFRLFGAHLNVLYCAGSLSALGSAILLFLVGRRLSSWLVGLTAGAVLLLQAFQPSMFSFPLPYSFSTVYGCVLGCIFLWIAVNSVRRPHSLWILAAGTTAAAALVFKPEYGTACYATLAPLIALRAFSEKSWRRLAKDIFAIIPGLVICGSVFLWMVSLEGADFIMQENLVGWPTSYFMKTYGRMWLQRNGFTVSPAAFQEAMIRTLPLAGVLLAAYCLLWWQRSDSRAKLIKAAVVGFAVFYIGGTSFYIFPPREAAQLVLYELFFPQDMVLYVGFAAAIAWAYFLARRNDNFLPYREVALLLSFSALLAFRILMKMQALEYPIFYNGPVVLSWLLLAVMLIPRAGRSQQFVFWGELVICTCCLVTVAIPSLREEAIGRNFVPLATDRGTIRAPKHLAENYAAAIQFMKQKSAAGDSVLSVPEDTSLYFLSGTICPTRVFSMTPGIVAPGKMTDKMIQEIDRKPVRYLLWSNRIFPEFGTPVFGKDFDLELGTYLKTHYHRVRPLVPNDGNYWDWNVTVWERNSPAKLQ